VKAVISVTTIPDRIEHIEPCLESLVVQELPVYLWVVPRIARSDTRLERVPKFPGVNVEMVEDRGPITKLLPALEREFDVILTADDDHIYGETWANGLLEWAENLPEAALGYGGKILDNNDYSKCSMIAPGAGRLQRADVLWGVYGVLYRRSMFDSGIFEEWKRWPTNDDLIITAHLKRRGVSRWVIPEPHSVRRYGRVSKIVPLWHINSGREKPQRHERDNEGLRVLGLGGHK